MRSSHSRAARSAAFAEPIAVSATTASATEYLKTIIEALLRLRGRLRIVPGFVRYDGRRDVRIAIVLREHAGQHRAAGERRGIFAVGDDVIREARGRHERRLRSRGRHDIVGAL